MKPIYIRREFEDGYLELQYRDSKWAEWTHFVPDPRKRKHHKPKFWGQGGACYGSPVHGMRGVPIGHYVEHVRERMIRRQDLIDVMLAEAIRRYAQREAKLRAV